VTPGGVETGVILRALRREARRLLGRHRHAGARFGDDLTRIAAAPCDLDPTVFTSRSAATRSFSGFVVTDRGTGEHSRSEVGADRDRQSRRSNT
jgi:hypothetical protein